MVDSSAIIVPTIIVAGIALLFGISNIAKKHHSGRRHPSSNSTSKHSILSTITTPIERIISSSSNTVSSSLESVLSSSSHSFKSAKSSSHSFKSAKSKQSGGKRKTRKHH